MLVRQETLRIREIRDTKKQEVAWICQSWVTLREETRQTVPVPATPGDEAPQMDEA